MTPETSSAPARAPVVIGFDGSPGARSAIDLVARLFPGRHAIVACIWSMPRELLAVYGVAATIVYEDDAEQRSAVECAEEGCRLARAAGLEAEPASGHAGLDGAWRALLDLADAREAS